MTSRIASKLRVMLTAAALDVKLTAAAALLLFCCALTAQAPAASAGQPTPEWKTYSNSSDGFSILFPGNPDVSKQRVPTGVGAFELRAYLVTPGDVALYVGVCDYGASAEGRDPQAVLAGAEKGAIDNVKAHLLTEQKITLGTYPGVEFDAENDTLHFTVRLYLVGATLYQVLAAAPLNDRFADSNRFLDSFQLIPRIAK